MTLVGEPAPTVTPDKADTLTVERKPDARVPAYPARAFVDEGSFAPITPEDDASGVLAGVGRVNGSPVVVFASDATVQGGAMGTIGCRHIVEAYDAAMRDRTPIIGFWHSGGARLRDGVESLDAIGRVFTAMTQASGRVPQLSVVLGPAAGGAAYGPALTDIVILAPNGRVFVTGPDVVRSVTGEDVDMARLGGPEVHGRRSGVVHVVADTEDAAYESTRELTELLGAPGPVRPDPVAEFDLGDGAARQPQACLRRAPDHQRPARQPGRRAARQVGAQHHHHARPHVRPHRRRHRQQPDAPRWLPRLDQRREGRPLRPHVRRVRRAARRRGRRPRLPARRRPGVGRRRPPRRQAAPRVRRGHRPARHAWSPARPTAARTSP